MNLADALARGGHDRLIQMYRAGQSPWIDNLTRDMLEGGDLVRLINSGIRGMTSNPAIFKNAITGSTSYRAEIETIRAEGITDSSTICWQLMISDIAKALELFEPLFEASNGEDGFVSLEVDPNLATDTKGTISAARSLHEAVGEKLGQQPKNLMIKVPATSAGIGAVESLTEQGFNINATLIFSVDRYNQVHDAYIRGLQKRHHAGEPIETIRSVASFFVSRVDSLVDDLLGEAPHTAHLRGLAANAQAINAYESFIQRKTAQDFLTLQSAGAHPQRPLWASTSTKNPDYVDTKYVDPLIAPDTVNTLPDSTVVAFADHGTLNSLLLEDPSSAFALARQQLDELADSGIKMAEVSTKLETDGVEAFVKSFNDLLASLS